MNMRYHEIFEAPIDQYAALGDWEDRKGSFNSSNTKEVSDKLVTNAKAVAKIRDIWQRVPQTFNFYMINIPGGEYHSHTIEDVDGFIAQPPRGLKPYMNQMKLANSAINVIYTTNFTNQANYMPMTAWIMAHRLWHIFQMEFGKESPIKHNIDILLSDAFAETASAYTGQENRRGENFFMLRGIPGQIREVMELIVPKVFTMRSARMDKLKNELDMPAELFAQYLISGKITFGELPETVEILDTGYNIHNRNVRGKTALTLKNPEANFIWGNLARELDKEFNSLLNSCVGKVLVL